MAPIAGPRRLPGRWRVRLLNEDGDIARPEQWNDPGKAKLWRYNLHYFDDLAADADAAHRDLQRELISRWIAENPPGYGCGWEPYPLSLRIVNWIKWALAGNALLPDWVQSLAVQTRWLTQRIEWHLLGNHLLANAKALVIAGLYFDGPEADSWLNQGLAIYAHELDEQILADGGHFELSPMYHAIILEDLLDVLNMTRAYRRASPRVIGALPGMTQRMRFWLAAMTHPDGGLSFFNDAAFGIAASHDELEGYARRLGLESVAPPGEGVHHLEASGYVRVNRGDMAAILDLAAVGPDYIPGHAHADTLSFELSLGSERLIVNGGTSTYAAGAKRRQQRSTASHSTVEIDGVDSSEVWGTFRVGRRARVSEREVQATDAAIVVTGRHDGYRRLPGAPTHCRTWRFENNKLSILDEFGGPIAKCAIARFHVPPGVALEVTPDGMGGYLRTASGRTIKWTADAPTNVQGSVWAPEFGKALPSSAIITRFVSKRLLTVFDWS